jgi:AraC-like DNA-binding protein
LGALQDRQIGHAISLIHREPARAWTVASLARELAMSRSAFAARFTVGELASRLGYRSEAAFARAMFDTECALEQVARHSLRCSEGGRRRGSRAKELGN